jgi:hypothetical protein
MLAMETYDYRNCQSLFGYAADVHERSGGICQLCGCGSREPDFDLWRQMTVEHLVGESQGGYRGQIERALVARFPTSRPPRSPSWHAGSIMRTPSPPVRLAAAPRAGRAQRSA